MYLIPGQDFDDWFTDLKTLTQLGPDHISAYTLTLEKGTELFKKVKNKLVEMPKKNKSAKWFKKTRDILSEFGYRQYEISNFTLSKIRVYIASIIGKLILMWVLAHLQTVLME